jgi:riboflavin synthase
VNQVELTIACSKIQDDMRLGDSISINGVCLTVVRYNDEAVTFDLSPETLRQSTFLNRSEGTRVNLERALRLDDRLGGHIVQGHVDALAEIRKINKIGGFYEIDFSLPKTISRYVVKKGSITIDGISLTIADMANDWFRIAIIPHTYEQTVLHTLKVGDSVHIETDVLARYLERLLFQDETGEKKQEITEEFLKKHGF